MKSIIASVAALVLLSSAGAFAESSDKQHGDARGSGAAEDAVDAMPASPEERGGSDGEKDSSGQRDSDLGTMGTGNTGTTGGMGATTGTDTIGGTIEE
ncbi:hypothetical protein [Stutzerimonas stutzeri]|jgi:hypothetical protein|uniref:Uncharacterized protein n=2 Tax=Stutzerimonas stutzeri TaxID=316 RepID=A4VKE2_STUS1|nr:hypothetical protein [Stutzerimonas stutzeri]OHC19973.1 MAG: hypothetical protein A2883_03480 [Pseudomonadales bacterium RIFCSPHIGHO2_01_FULL_64_12]HAN53483.1 hypothetical protein [Pseudomonas sp.]ABP79443.1 conserved hypothetical protein [Stutzerimonas stutzeri A1501]AWL01980.1 hypothetical protein C6Y50_19230 [Stutzerimonas stutzeri]MBH3352969.1 hypothetical protein [Stutzerimonas stutzeri]